MKKSIGNRTVVGLLLFFFATAPLAVEVQFQSKDAPAPTQRAPASSPAITKDSPALKREVAPDFLVGSRSAQRIRAKGLDPKDPAIAQKLAALATQYSRNFGTKTPSVRYDKPMMNRSAINAMLRRDPGGVVRNLSDTTPPNISCVVGIVSPGQLKRDDVQENEFVFVFGRFPSIMNAALKLWLYQFPCGTSVPMKLINRSSAAGAKDCGGDALPPGTEILTYELPTFPPFQNADPGIESADVVIDSPYGYATRRVHRIRGFPGKTIITVPISLSPPYQSGDVGIGLQPANNFFTGSGERKSTIPDFQGGTGGRGLDVIGRGINVLNGFAISARIVSAHSYMDAPNASEPWNVYRGTRISQPPQGNRLETRVEWFYAAAESIDYVLEWTLTGPGMARPLSSMPKAVCGE